MADTETLPCQDQTPLPSQVENEETTFALGKERILVILRVTSTDPMPPMEVLESSHYRQRHGCPPQEPLQSLEGDGHQEASGLYPCPALPAWTHPGLIR